MWRDRWLVLGVLGAMLTCTACLTQIGGLVLGALSLGAWAGRVDFALGLLLLGFLCLFGYRLMAARRKAAG